jgi:hypothetical protein
MAGAFDEAVDTGLQRQHGTMEILTDLLRAQPNDRYTDSIRYRMSASKLPVARIALATIPISSRPAMIAGCPKAAHRSRRGNR